MRQHPLVNGTTIWDAASMNPSDAYKESISYDANGNIQTFVRNGKEGNVLMDNLVYMYEVDPVTGKKLSNKLRQVKDGVAAAAYAEDLDNQESEDNYQYDAIGNLTKDIKEGITAIDWTVYGKISSIAKAGSTINYTYDASGNRVSKTVTPTNGTGVITFYVRDAQGNTLGIYERDTNKQILWKEQTLYGSSRLGMFRPDADVSAGASDADIASKLWANYVGYQNYELGNHLGSVLVTISDKRTLVNGAYEADVITANDLYPFGSPMPGRTYAAANSNYRYGFGGKEKDNEIKGEGNSIDFGARMYDSRLGRWLSLDPLEAKYPHMSAYVAFGNSPIIFKDPDGKDIVYFNAAGLEVKRVVSKTQFETWVEANNSYVQAPMPKILKGYEAPIFQKHDYEIAAQTFVFNQTPGDKRPKTAGGKSLSGEQPAALDPTLVKSLIMQETHMGTDKGHGKNDGTKDIMQANVWYSEKSNDWGDFKAGLGLKKGEGATPHQSVFAGIRILYIKGLITGSGKNATTSWRGGDLSNWWTAVKRYNGGGVENYDGQVKKKYDGAVDPKPENYVKPEKEKAKGN